MRRPSLTFRALGTGLLLVLATLLVAPTSPAQAGTTLLCKGFSDCARKGYGNYGYAAVYRQMHWRMYGGHNCTNYAAYRMIQMGGPASRPWSGSGNASNWGVALASKTDKTPTVGSVAWWRGRNHVQIVEKVVDANTLVISEDHWGGDFDWAVVRRSSGHWPDGFIHIVDAPLKAVSAPTTPAAAEVGVPITATPGSWPAGSTLQYQWLAAAAPGSPGGYPIPGATSTTYVPRPEDAGKWLMFRVLATKPGHTLGKAYSAKTEPVALGRQQAAGAPTVAGFAKVGDTLQGTVPSISPAPAEVTHSWRVDGQPVPGATGPAFALQPGHLGKTVSYVVLATRPGYQPLVLQSAPTEPVGPEQMTQARPARLTGAQAYGGTLTLDPGAVDVPGAQLAVRWYRNGVMQRDVTGATYRLGAADLGKRISAKVAWRHAGYPDVVSEVRSGVVRATPTLRITSTRDRKVRVSLDVPGSVGVWGNATLRLPDGRVRQATVRGGRARFEPVPAGRYTVVISYAGNRNARPTTWTRVVRVGR